jgi:DNA-binding MarR family transcriptional regulator
VPVGIDREMLHELLWEQRYGDDLVDLNQQTLAEHLVVTKPTMSRVVKDLVTAGRLEKLGEHTYRVYDPDSV